MSEHNNKRTTANPDLFNVDYTSDDNEVNYEVDAPQSTDTQLVLDKQLAIIREGQKFLEDFNVLLDKAEQAKKDLTAAINNAGNVRVRIKEADMKSLQQKVDGLVSSINTATSNCNTAVTKTSDDAKASFKKTYDEMGNSMRDAVSQYARKTLSESENALDKKQKLLEKDLKGYFIPQWSYWLHHIILIVTFVFGVFGAFILYPTVVTTVMGWTMVTFVGIALFILLMVRLSDL